MLHIKSPVDNPELHYSLFVCFKEFLGVEYNFSFEKGLDCFQISLDSSPFLLEIACTFSDSDAYFSKGFQVPQQPLENWCPRHYGLQVDLVEETLPILFGSSVFQTKGNTTSWGVDVFSTIFFMLSRIEEVGSMRRDMHGRFPASASLAYKENFLERPLLDEYLEVLWAIFLTRWPDMERLSVKSNILVTCDVDEPFDKTVDNIHVTARTCLSDVIKRKSLRLAGARLLRYCFNKVGNYTLDNKYTFDWYMDECEKNGLSIAFYFIPTSIEAKNGSYELSETRIQKLLINIALRGHEIGVHGSYQTYIDLAKMAAQKKLLSERLDYLVPGVEAIGNRQHYLRWDSAVTPSLLDSAGFIYDTTGGYADNAGFRFGTSKEFPMWDLKERRRLNLRQRPLIVMDATVFSKKYMGFVSLDSGLKYIYTLMERSLKYGGNFTLLWHNSFFSDGEFKQLFEQLVKKLGEVKKTL